MVEGSQPDIKIECLPKRARYHKIVAEKFEPLVDIVEITKENQHRRAAVEKAKKESEERVAQTLYLQSLQMQESLAPIQKGILDIVTSQLYSEEGQTRLKPTGSNGRGSPENKTHPKEKPAADKVIGDKSKRELPPIEKSAASFSRVLKKKIVLEDGEPKNYHVDYTGKMIYYDNQK